MTNEQAIKVLLDEWKCIDRNDGINCDRQCEKCDLVMDSAILKDAYNMAIKALSQEPCDVSEYDKDHIWYKGGQYISLRRFLEVKAEAEKEPCEDAISRAEVKRIVDFYKEQYDGIYHINESVDKLPSVTPSRHRGRWIRTYDSIVNAYFWECDKCKCGFQSEHNYCPNCGAKMVEPQESEDK